MRKREGRRASWEDGARATAPFSFHLAPNFKEDGEERRRGRRRERERKRGDDDGESGTRAKRDELGLV